MNRILMLVMGIIGIGVGGLILALYAEYKIHRLETDYNEKIQ